MKARELDDVEVEESTDSIDDTPSKTSSATKLERRRRIEESSCEGN